MAILIAALWIRSYFRCDWIVHAQATLPYNPGVGPNDATGGSLDPSLHGIVVGSGGVLFFIVRNLPDGLSRVRLDPPSADGWHFGSEPHPSYPDCIFLSSPVCRIRIAYGEAGLASRMSSSTLSTGHAAA